MCPLVPDRKVYDCNLNLFNLYWTHLVDSSQTFPAHKSILIGRSQVLAEWLLNNKKEDKTLIIRDMKLEALREMLRFFYTDQVHNDQAPLYGLFHLFCSTSFPLTRTR